MSAAHSRSGREHFSKRIPNWEWHATQKHRHVTYVLVLAVDGHARQCGQVVAMLRENDTLARCHRRLHPHLPRKRVIARAGAQLAAIGIAKMLGTHTKLGLYPV